MWLDLNGSPSLNYIHFTCHLVFKNRNHCSLGEKKTEPASVYDMPQKGQTHLNQEYATQILERWLKRAPAALSYSLTGAACSGSGIHFKLDKQATAFKKKKSQGARQSWISTYLSVFLLAIIYSCIYRATEVAHRQGPAVKKRQLQIDKGAAYCSQMGPQHIRRTKSEGVPRETGH